LVSDFGPKISFKIVDILRDDIKAGKLKSGTEIKVKLVDAIVCFSVLDNLNILKCLFWSSNFVTIIL
jgi:hypothetical protein